VAQHLVQVRTPLAPGAAFAYLADLSNLPRWDPGVTRAEQVAGTRPGIDAAFDIWIKGLRTPLHYVTNEYEPPTRVVVQASGRLLTTLDAITVEPHESGAIVTYDAQLALKGPLVFFDALLARVFRRAAGRAAVGLADALHGSLLDHATA
jgi:hypothetical protein